MSLFVFLHDYRNSYWTLCVSYMTIEQFSWNFFFLSLVWNYEEEDATLTSIQLSSYRTIGEKAANKTSVTA